MEKEILKKNIAAHGEYIQLQVLEEECAELIQAVSKGIIFHFHNEADINVFDGYYKQKFASKKFIKVDE